MDREKKTKEKQGKDEVEDREAKKARLLWEMHMKKEKEAERKRILKE